MNTQYRTFPQQQQQPPQRSPHAPASRRGIGPMVGAHPQNSLTPAQMAAQQQAQLQASDRAKLRSRKPTDKNLPEGVEDCIIGDGVQRYKELRELERRLDATMMRKRLDIQESVSRNVKRSRTLRIWVSNTVEDQPWQGDILDVVAFDFSPNTDASYRVKIEGKLLEEEDDGLASDDEDEDDSANEDAMDAAGDSQGKKKKPEEKQYKLSHFFKGMTVDFDKTRVSSGTDHVVEWKKPAVAPNAANPPAAADFDQLEFKRGGDENTNIVINLTRDETPERFQLKETLVDILDMSIATRAEVVLGIWDYIKVNGLQDEDEKRSFECDERLRPLFGNRDKGYIPYIPEVIVAHMEPLQPVKLEYTIRVDRQFHEDPQPTIYDITVQIDDPIRDALQTYMTNPSYAANLREITNLNDQLAILVQKASNSKSKHSFFDSLSRNPTEFIARWLSSQKRDLEVIAGEATRGGGEDATGDEWRRGGKDGIWGSENVRESVNLMINAKSRN